jgi:hypothetical protein
MRRSQVWAAVAAAATGIMLLPGGARAAGNIAGGPRSPAPGTLWGNARLIPGILTLNKGGNAEVVSLSCASGGNCAAGGYYTDGSGHSQAFVVSQRRGTWGRAIELPGTGKLNIGHRARVAAVSCPAAGDCVAGGFYTGKHGLARAFVASQHSGHWNRAIEVPGTAALGKAGSVNVGVVSCPAAGDCAAGGTYPDGDGQPSVFVVNERHGKWGTALKLPGLGGLGTGGQINSMSCPSVGNCAIAGAYYKFSSAIVPFVATERRGKWGKAQKIPGLAAVNTKGFGYAWSVSCPSAGNCSAGGYYTNASDFWSPFVVNERNGRWATAVTLSALPPLKWVNATILAMSCPAAGRCLAGGFYAGGAPSQPLVATESGGSWSQAFELPGAPVLNKGDGASLGEASCASPGNCAVGGYYTDADGSIQAFVASELGGVWTPELAVPGTVVLNDGGNAQTTALSCTAASVCGAGGFYKDSHGRTEPFVVSES